MVLKQIDNFKQLKSEELEQKILEIKREIFELQIKKVTRQSIKPHLFKYKKHQLAQLLTIKTQKIKES